MDKRMHLSADLDMENSCTDQESHGEQIICGDANSGLVLKFEMDKYWTFPSEEKENARDPLDNVQVNCAQNVPPLLEHSEDANVALVEMPMAHPWHPKQGTATLDLSHSVTCSSDAHSSGERAEMRDNAATFLTTLVKGLGKENGKVPMPSSVAGSLSTICNKTSPSNQGLGSHMFVRKEQKKTLLGESGGSSSVSGEQCTLKYACRKCKERFPTRKLLGGHIRKHWWEAFKRTSSAPRRSRKRPMPTSSAPRKNRKPLMPLAPETVQSGPVVLPADKGKLPPRLLCGDNMRPTRMDLVVANATAHQLLPLDFDTVHQQQQAKRLGNETESPSSSVPQNLIKTGVALPAPKQIPQEKSYVADLNMVPPDETDGWKP